MDCEQALPLLHADLDREIRSDERVLLEDHLRTCPGCRTQAEALRGQDSDLRRAFAVRRQAVSRLANRIEAQIRVSVPTARRRISWMPLVISAAAGFLIAVLLFRPWTQSKHAEARNEPAPQTQPVEKSPSPPEPKIYVALAPKPVYLCPADHTEWDPLPQGGALSVGSSVRTGSDTRCELRTPDGSEIRLDVDTEIVLTDSRQVRVVKGQILARVEEAPAPFQVTVARTTITALGTEFDVESRRDDTLLTVLEGATRVEGAGAKDYVLSGERARIVGNRLIEKHELRSLLSATGWTNELQKLKKHNDPELVRRTNDILAQIGETKAGFFSEEAIRSLGIKCVLPLTRFIQSDRSRNEQKNRHIAARILADYAQPWSIPDLIKLLADKDGEVRAQAAKALTNLTNQDFGRKPEEWKTRPWDDLAGAYQKWKTWWLENKQNYPPPP
jgi:ferric-dicitrate binding protein FerR (iron transport regulator)